MAAKRPTGERPKQLSTLAKTVKSAARGGVASKSGKVEVLTPSQAAARAGKMRDQASSTKLKQTNLDKTAGSRSKSGGSALSAVAKRFGITAREARDIATAVGSAATAIRKSPQEGMPVKKIVKNVAKQVKEVGTAATTGKKGTSAYQVKPNAASQRARGAAGDKGFVTYNVKGSKKR
jgi:hypothetical protein